MRHALWLILVFMFPAGCGVAAQGASSSLGPAAQQSGCHARGLLPDPACTPGAIFTGTSRAQICTPGYARGVRSVSLVTKHAVYAAYGIARHHGRRYEVDHLVPLELGGSNSRANLWPQVAPGYGQKDVVENELHDAVCSGRMELRRAQALIARDWRHTGVHLPPARGRPRGGPSPPTGGGTPGFCNTHPCIANFANGRGTVVQCADGRWSHSGGLPGVCGRHGGVR